MKEFEYILLCVIFLMVSLGMAQLPPKTPSVSVCYNQQITPFVNKLIQDCIRDCTVSKSTMNCTKICDDEAVFAVGENHDQIINQYGNVL